jgi:hypothetical protein
VVVQDYFCFVNDDKADARPPDQQRHGAVRIHQPPAPFDLFYRQTLTQLNPPTDRDGSPVQQCLVSGADWLGNMHASVVRKCS